MTNKDKLLDAEVLEFHANDRPGKFQIAATKPLTSQHDLSLAYSPGVAAPCLKIAAISTQHMTTQTKVIKLL